MVIFADRSFKSKPISKQLVFYKILGTNITTKPMFAAFSKLGQELLTENADFQTYQDLIDNKDFREKDKRDNARKNCATLGLLICDEVNKIANNDPLVYGEAGLEYNQEKNPRRSVGGTEILSVEFNIKTRRVEIRVRKADKAASYQIDIQTPEGETLEEFAVISNTKGNFPPPSKPGMYRCRVVPRDSKYNQGPPTAWKDLGIS